jgi:patatin-like phospholipase/acyl hydrolase
MGEKLDRLHRFRTYDVSRPERGNKNRTQEEIFGDSQKADAHEIWEIAQATPAAPSFFPPAQAGDKMYYDAVIRCKNPSFEAYSET